MLAGSGAAGAPVKMTVATTWLLSTKFPLLSTEVWLPCGLKAFAEMHPVLRGLTAVVHDPAVSEGAVGGSGSSLTLTGSGVGAGGLSRTSGMNWLAQSHCAGRSHVATSWNGFPAVWPRSLELSHLAGPAGRSWRSRRLDTAGPAASHAAPLACRKRSTLGSGVMVAAKRDPLGIES